MRIGTDGHAGRILWRFPAAAQLDVRHMKALWPLLFALGCSIAYPSSASVAAPATLDEAFRALDSLLGPTRRDSFMHTPERGAVVYAHMGIGLYIRNEWFRSGKSPLAGVLHQLGARSLDDASSMVLTSYWRHLNGKPLELEKQGACYQRWGDEQERLEKEAEAKGETSYNLPAFDCPTE